MTAFPESEAHTSLAWNALFASNTRRMASTTAVESMMAPSTMLSGGIGSMPNATTRYALPAGLSSTALTALDPMSSPTIALLLRNTTIYLLNNLDETQAASLDAAHVTPGLKTRPAYVGQRLTPGLRTGCVTTLVYVL